MKKGLYFLATVLTGMAVVIVSTASFYYVHQEETPEELLK